MIALQHWGYKVFEFLANGRIRKNIPKEELANVIKIRNAAVIDLDPAKIGGAIAL